MKDLDWFERWFALYKKHEEANFKEEKARQAFEKDFTELSKEWLDTEFKSIDFADAWCNISDMVLNGELKTPEEAYNAARAYLEYVTDRMCINRWLYIRTLLNRGIE